MINLDLENVVDSHSRLLKKVSSLANIRPTPKKEIQRKIFPLNVVNAQAKNFTLSTSTIVKEVHRVKSTKNTVP